MKSYQIIIFVVTLVIAYHDCHQDRRKSLNSAHLVQLLKAQSNLFGKLNKHIQKITNNLFDSLNLTKQFSQESKIKLLLTMHYDLNNIAEENYEAYNGLKNLTAIETVNNVTSKIRLDEFVSEALNEIQFDKDDKVNSKNDVTKLSTKTPKSTFKDNTELNEFIKAFVGRIGLLTIDDLLRRLKADELLRMKVSARRNLKPWKPPATRRHIASKVNDHKYYNKTARRIFRGKRTNIKKYPFIASIHILGEFTCAGSIISQDLVLTAASCLQVHYNNRFFRENPKITYVRIGSDWALRLGELIPVLEIYFNPIYDPKTLKNNLALVRLQRTIKFGRHRKAKVRRIQLDQGDGILPTNTNNIIILGWGARTPNQIVKKFEKLNSATLEVFPHDECKEIYSKDFVHNTNFCAGYMSKGSGACNRDVGGPGIAGGKLIGVVSFGSPLCGGLDYPTVFTRVGPYLHWIESILYMNTERYGEAKTTKRRVITYQYTPFVSTTTEMVLEPITPTTPGPLSISEDTTENLKEESVENKREDFVAVRTFSISLNTENNNNETALTNIIKLNNEVTTTTQQAPNTTVQTSKSTTQKTTEKTILRLQVREAPGEEEYNFYDDMKGKYIMDYFLSSDSQELRKEYFENQEKKSTLSYGTR